MSAELDLVWLHAIEEVPATQVMKKETVTALRKSIAHWKLIAAGKAYSYRGNTCALCLRFGRSCILGDEICPVAIKTRMRGCLGTPYTDFYGAAEVDQHFYRWARTPEAVRAALAEVAFLESLLPEEK